MLKIFNTSQIRELDAYTIKHEPVASIDLMERACRAFVNWFTAQFDSSSTTGIVCGRGNNGGDGLGIARMLHQLNYPVKVWIIKGGANESADFKTNLARLKEKMEVMEIISSPDKEGFSVCKILIDAIFGSGLSRPAEGIYAATITAINQTSPAIRVAIDIPSGLFADRASSGEIIKAHHTVSFQFPKLAFLLPENQHHVGEWHTVDIGLNEVFINQTETPYYYLTHSSVKNILKPLSKFAHKGDNGKALLIAGSYGKMGACILAARSALRSGMGLLSAHIPKSGYSIIQSAVPEAMASIDEHDLIFSSCPALETYSAIGIGPGIGVEKETVKALKKVLESGKSMVIDADALNVLSTHGELLHLVPKGSILTPHPREFERLVGKWKNDFERLNMQIQLSKQIRSLIVLKGAHTSIATPEGKVYFNSTGNPGMAKGGSGDVLTGILTGLLAQGYSADKAAILGIYLHGLSADLAASQTGMRSLLPSDIIDFLPHAYRKLQS